MNPKYRKPPITEAIIDIRVEPRPGASAVEIAAGLGDWDGIFPVSLRQVMITTQSFPFPVSFQAGSTLDGFRYKSSDGLRIVQARRDGFVFSFVGDEQNQYPGWNLFRAEAEQYWRKYLEVWQPRAVIRLALRYVNQFSVNMKADGINTVPPTEYVRAIQIPRAQFLQTYELSQFTLQMVSPQPDINAAAVINSRFLPISDRDALSVLDIDVFQDVVQLAIEDPMLWERLDQLRDRKNALFQSLITDAVEQSLDPEQPS